MRVPFFRASSLKFWGQNDQSNAETAHRSTVRSRQSGRNAPSDRSLVPYGQGRPPMDVFDGRSYGKSRLARLRSVSEQARPRSLPRRKGRLTARIAFLLGRALGRLLRRRRARRRKLETAENDNGALPAFAFTGCSTRAREVPITITYCSQPASAEDVVAILERGTSKPKRKRRPLVERMDRETRDGATSFRIERH